MNAVPEARYPGRRQTLPNALIQRKSKWLVMRFYLSMLAIAAIDFCFAVIYAVPLYRFAPTALLLIVLTLLGAHWIYRPILRFLRDPQSTALPVRRIASLSRSCTLYVAAMISLLAAVKFLVLPPLLGFDIASLLTRNERLWLPVLHTLYYTALIYFVMVDYEAVLRLRIFSWYGRLVPATRGHLLHRLLVAFGVTSLLPFSLLMLHALEHDLVVERQILFQDMAASALAFVVTLFFVTRGLLRPIHALEAATSEVQRNDLTVTVPVLSNDETGRLASRFNQMVNGLRERALIRETFGRYLPERVAAAILSSAGHLAPKSEIATILYADIEDFTRMAELASPNQVVTMLNEYFSAVVEPIEQNDGVVTQFQGDALLVTFNLPIRDDHHALSALRCALAIQQICKERQFSGTTLKARIGIATGRVTAGNVGSDSRLTYTVHGDAVNIAARLEQLNKQFGTQLLFDGATSEAVQHAIDVHFVADVKIRGRESNTAVFTVEASQPASHESRAFPLRSNRDAISG